MADLMFNKYIGRDMRRNVIIAVIAVSLLLQLGFLQQYFSAGIGKYALIAALSLSGYWVYKTS